MRIGCSRNQNAAGSVATRWAAAAATGLALIMASVTSGSLAAAPAPPSAGSGVPTWAGTWRRLPPAPFSHPASLTAQWTGTRLFVWNMAFGGGRPHNAAATFSPTRGSWRRLRPPQDPTFAMGAQSVWTGREVLILSQSGFAYAPRTGRWRRFQSRGGAGVVVWTGRELIVWGGGCCGDQTDKGSAYNPATDTWRTLPPSPLTARQSPLAVWTGREVIITGGEDARSTSWPEAVLRDAAAYNPLTDTWRRLSPMPARQMGAGAVWTGRQMLIVGGTMTSRGFAYNPRTDRWRRLHSLGQPRRGNVVWTGGRAVIWGGNKRADDGHDTSLRALAHDPVRDRWSVLPKAPFDGGRQGIALWTGRQLIVWGSDGSQARGAWAAFTPRTG